MFSNSYARNLAAVLILAGVRWAGAEDIVLKAEPAEISAGASTLLTWQIDGTQSVYLSGVGLVQPTGSRSVSPPLTTNYFLIAQDGTAVAVHSVRVTVNGTKGGDEFPSDLDRFIYPISTTASISTVALLGKIRHILQDTLQFSLKEYTQPDGAFIFLTNVSERPSLKQKEDKGIAARRIGFRIDVLKPLDKDNRITCQIRTLIDYRRRIERTWRPDPEDKLHREQADLVRQKIDENEGDKSIEKTLSP